MRKNFFADNSRVEPTIFLMEKLSFSLKLFTGHFYGQSFIIKTVQGPLVKAISLLRNELINSIIQKHEC